MPYCSNCHNLLPDNVTVCNYCGTVYQNKVANNTYNPIPNNPSTNKKGFFSWLKRILLIKDCTRDFYSTDALMNRFFAMLSYIGLLAILPIIFRRRSPYAIFHINQGVANTLFMLILTIAIKIIEAIFFRGSSLSGVCNTIQWVYIGVSAFGIIQCFLHIAYELPIIGRFKLFKSK